MADRDASTGTEHATLREFLDDQREALIGKLDGLDEDQARTTPTPSALSLLSIVKHSATWEHRWFQIIAAGRGGPDDWPSTPADRHHVEDPTFRIDPDDTIASVVDDYRRQIAASNEILDELDLATPCARQDLVDENLRWVAVHMIEETARHAGHADIIREAIDGARDP